jgi:hypothetical protein
MLVFLLTSDGLNQNPSNLCTVLFANAFPDFSIKISDMSADGPSSTRICPLSIKHFPSVDAKEFGPVVLDQSTLSK